MGSAKGLSELGLPNLPSTSWAVLGLLSFGEELSGYDIKKWSDWNIRYFYWSPSFSQIYSELKRLQSHGYATSREQESDEGPARRSYTITDAGMAAIRQWATHAPVDPPVLKHSLLLRIWLGHLSEPHQLKKMLHDHIAYLENRQREAAIDFQAASAEPAWAYPRVACRWSEHYYAAERELALELIRDIDEAEATLTEARSAAPDGLPSAKPGSWREIEKQAQAQKQAPTTE